MLGAASQHSPTTLVVGVLAFGALALAACDDPTGSAPRPRAEARAGTQAEAPAPGAQFTVTRRDLGTLGGKESRAIGNNDHGVVVGWSLNAAGQKRAFKWTAGGGMRALPTLAPGTPCQANHVNEGGQVAGFCLNASGKRRAVLWSATGTIRNLGTLPSGARSEATDVNDAGVVVGTSDVLINGTHRQHAFKWTAAGGMKDLGVLPPSPGCSAAYSLAQRINKAGQIAGTSLPGHCQGNESAVRWSATGAIDDLDRPNDDTHSYAHGINDLGHVAGGATLAALWKSMPGSNWQTIGTLPGGEDLGSAAYSVNNSDEVVGVSGVAGGHGHAFVWTQTGGIRDLGTLPGGTDSHANDINNRQQVVGWSNKSGGVIHATLWTLR